MSMILTRKNALRRQQMVENILCILTVFLALMQIIRYSQPQIFCKYTWLELVSNLIVLLQRKMLIYCNHQYLLFIETNFIYLFVFKFCFCELSVRSLIELLSTFWNIMATKNLMFWKIFWKLIFRNFCNICF